MAKQPPPPGLPLRIKAAEKLRDVLGGAHFSPLTSDDLPDGRDRAIANRLVTTALRRHGQIDVILAELLDRGLPRKSGSFEAVMRLSLAQLVWLPDLGAHSALFLAVEALKRDTKAAHLTGLANAVLRRAQAESLRYLDLPDHLLIPDALKPGWSALYGEEAIDRFAAALIAGASLDLTLRDEDPELVAALGGVPVMADTVRIETRDRPVEAMPGYAEGRFWVQDAAAAIPARLIDLPQGARVLDLCAAPGGKTAQLAKAGYRVTALDSDATRLMRLKDNIDRLGYTAEIVTADAANYAPREKFDAALLDAPCSATGTFRRHPEVLWRRTREDIMGRAALQRRLIANAAASLNPGGILVYCVCSLEPEEGEAQLPWVLAHQTGLEPFKIDPAELNDLEGAVTTDGCVRTHPGLVTKDGGALDGFFVARFRRRA
ncbi:methyltransferase domain-containing protein [Arsenicitalea aurantiaca]|uniref:Methyltransferase domain-containing protein n=1 Tax=Arsenicitalea aurantiaca TaxID=1783274 RepID=A0A433X5L9_9HYPH|nr:RsmB/NOP family class I SAM-dependent RNA methyltransferase [Arsenicitalea aurantiaca]RUT29341.1 methyltransferase domain-containing protein [Arsenicitalea aurantiaca]